jgi:hypothetical protein
MNEPLTQTIKEGYRNWRNNLILGVPHLTSTFLSIILTIVVFIAAAALFGLQNNPSEIGSFNPGALLLPSISLFVGFLLILFINAYFSAGAIGMSIKAIETGKTNLGDMFSYGRRNVVSVFLSLFLLAITSIVFLIVLLIPAGIAYSANLLGLGTGLLICGGVLYAAYLVLLMFSYSVAPVAIVAKNIGGVEGIKEGISYARKNKLRLFLFWGFYFFVSQLFGFAFEFIIGPLNYVNMISPVVYGLLILGLLIIYFLAVLFTLVPLFYVLITRMYLSTNIGIKKTVSKPYEPAVSRAQFSKPRELYI